MSPWSSYVFSSPNKSPGHTYTPGCASWPSQEVGHLVMWDPSDLRSAFDRINEARSKDEILTGLIFLDLNTQDLHDIIHTTLTPLNALHEMELYPGNEALEKIYAEHR